MLLKKCAAALAVMLFAGSLLTVNAQNAEFNYQGILSTSGTVANGSFDFEFLLFDSSSGGTQVGPTLTRTGVAVTNGIFAVSLDFGSQFPGAQRFLEIRVRPTGGGAFTPLLPRQPVNSTPYAIKSVNADNATNATTAQNALQLGGVAANQYVVTTDPRMTDDRAPTAGSPNYVQNQNAGEQAASNFNISGDGTAGGTLSGNIVNAATQYDIGGDRVLSVVGAANVFAGVGAGSANGTGFRNSFFGRDAGLRNTSGNSNSLFGHRAGEFNTIGFDNSFFGAAAGGFNGTGNFNSFFGTSAGHSNTSGSSNSFFGVSAGFNNDTGIDNSFFGRLAGSSNTTGNNNSFFGRDAGFANTIGDANSFFGTGAGEANTTGDVNSFFGGIAGHNNTTGKENSFVGVAAGGLNSTGTGNTFIGHLAGQFNTTGGRNTAIGAGANVATGGLAWATAIGADAVVSTSNTIVLGRIDGLDRVRISGLGSAGATALCRNANMEISTCSSSLRYKSEVSTFLGGLDMVGRLRPITFDWKDGGMNDLGLGAEDVAAIEPLLVTYNAKGEIEGVKYDRIGVVLVNAVKEQQDEIIGLRTVVREQQNRIEKQQRQMTALIQYICAADPKAAVCTEEK